MTILVETKETLFCGHSRSNRLYCNPFKDLRFISFRNYDECEECGKGYELSQFSAKVLARNTKEIDKLEALTK